MKRLTFILALALAPTLFAWNNTGHQAVAGIAWDNMTPAARQKAIALLQSAPADACLADLFPADARPLEVRQREFFMRAATWADIIRPERDKPSPCDRFHRSNWHFINYFWEGRSGAAGEEAPKDRNDIVTPEINAVAMLHFLRPAVSCTAPGCTTDAERATNLAWILHLVGDIHQPLHTTARVTNDHRDGDQGGNLFPLGPLVKSRNLHGFWDNILENAEPRPETEAPGAYADRMIAAIAKEHPKSAFAARIRSGEFDAWAREGFETTKSVIYPEGLAPEYPAPDAYLKTAFATAKPAIALGGYRLADLLNQIFK